jgi:hypothetical protein
VIELGELRKPLRKPEAIFYDARTQLLREPGVSEMGERVV